MRAPVKLTCHWRKQLYRSLRIISNYLTSSLTEIEPSTGKANQPEESMEKM